jgi:hypothetical protein
MKVIDQYGAYVERGESCAVRVKGSVVEIGELFRDGVGIHGEAG